MQDTYSRKSIRNNVLCRFVRGMVQAIGEIYGLGG